MLYNLEKMKETLGSRYSFHQSKSIDDIKKILETGEMEGNDTVPFVLEVGNLDIEMNINNSATGVLTDNGVETSPLTLSYYCCVCTNGEWESYDDIPYTVNLDAPDIETEMFSVLDRFALERCLSFFDENEHVGFKAARAGKTKDIKKPNIYKESVMNDYKNLSELFRIMYPEDTKIELISMDDPYRDMPKGLKGIVSFVDDACQIHCDWENGSTLALIPGVDSFCIVREREESAEGLVAPTSELADEMER